jgi:hypothetical protein
MPTSTIHVQHSDGSPCRHVRVTLEFSYGLTGGAYTNNYGEAVIDHTTTGTAWIHVDGKRYHSFHAPARQAVTVR